MGIMTILSAIGKIIEALPMQGRIERTKNKLDNLKKEKGKLVGGKATIKKAKRLAKVKKEIAKLNQSLKNYAKD